MTLTPVILCGGSGSRLWPLSRALLPKQFLPLVTERSQLQETILRVQGIPDLAAPLLVSHHEHRFIAAEQLREVGIAPLAHLLEPVGRSTAPAVAAAALVLLERDADAVMLVLPADHSIERPAAFRSAAENGRELALDGRLVTFGVAPTHEATGYGYIRRGAAIPGVSDAYEVSGFVEKPDAARAARYLADGGYYWNAGIFVFRASRLIEELKSFRPDVLAAVSAAVGQSNRDLEFLRLGAAPFESCASVSIDTAIMEKTHRACVIETDMGWSDLGSWSSLWDVASKDANGNSTRGDVYLDRTADSYIRAEDRLVAAVGVEHLVIVETADAVLVAAKRHAEDVKLAVEHLRSGNRGEHFTHRRVYRPWGQFEQLGTGDRFQVKRLTLKPGAKISLQRHRQRAEHWVVVSGTARVTCDDQVRQLAANQSAYIPPGARHRLENVGEGPLIVIEVQSGDYLGEDDIERFDDDYRRG